MISFDPEEIDKLEKIRDLYAKTKGWMLYAEEIDPEFKSFVQPVNELRHAFDHLMRLFAVKLEIREEPEEGYVKTHLEKTLAHVFRGAFDTLDKLSITIRKKIINEVSPFSSDTINMAIPEYYSKIKPDIEEINKRIAEIRANKDVASIAYDEIEEYSNLIERLKEYYTLILEKKSKLIEYEKESMRKENKVFVLIAGAIGGGLLTGILFGTFEAAIVGALIVLIILRILRFVEQKNV